MVLVQKLPFFQPFFLRQYRPEKCVLSYSRTKKLLSRLKKRKRGSKSRKIEIFPNGLSHGFFSKMEIFPTFFFQAIQARKMSFMIFQNEKTPFQAVKTRSLKGQKIERFPKGLTHGFGPKRAIFPTFFFRQYRPGKCLL